MELIEITDIKEYKRTKTWHVLKFRGYSLKIYDLWIQIYTTPEGYRGSGVMGNKSFKKLVSDIQAITKDQPK